MKKLLAVLAGGYSPEWEISLNSAEMVAANVDEDQYEAFIVLIRKDNWIVRDGDKEAELDLNEFGFRQNGQMRKFDLAFNAIHGDPGENGKLQGYFEARSILHTSCSQALSALTFSKWECNTILQKLGFTCARSILTFKGDELKANDVIDQLGLPLFVKPNNSGSSFGVSKVKSEEDLEPALEKAFREDDAVLIEAFMDGVEVGCGVYKYKGEVIALMPTEIRSQNEFFDYEAKYQGKSEEITPAQIPTEQIEKVREISAEVYRKMHARGIVRVDFIIVKGQAHIIEINTIPGLSSESIVPKQVRHEGMSLKEFFGRLLEEATY